MFGGLNLQNNWVPIRESGIAYWVDIICHGAIGGILCPVNTYMSLHVLCTVRHLLSMPSALSRCPIFWRLPVKMPHLSAGEGLLNFMFTFCTVKMSHISAATCQDAPSFGRGRFIEFYVYLLRCQDVSYFGSYLSRCPPSFGRGRFIEFYVYLLCCQGVPSFGSYL